MQRKRITAAVCVVLVLISILPAIALGLPFSDVPRNAWYYDAVQWAYENRYMTGVSATKFNPGGSCTRGQFVTILWTLSGKPKVSTPNPFKDVKSGDYYYRAVLWAKKNSIIAGTDATHFSPNKNVTKGQAIAVIFKYMKGKAPSAAAGIAAFPDVKSGAYYYKAVMWAADRGIEPSDGMTNFQPNSVATRAMVAHFLYKARHELNGGKHRFTMTADEAVSCTQMRRTYACSCGNIRYAFRNATGQHSFTKAKLVSDATLSKATVYQLVCDKCGMPDGKGNRTLGFPIYRNPIIGEMIPTHHWTNAELNSGIVLANDSSMKITVTRKWFAAAWCYIAHVEISKSQLSRMHTECRYKGGGVWQPYTTAYSKMRSISGAKLLVNGDAVMCGEHPTLRNGVIYGTEADRYGRFYWNPSNATYGSVEDLGFTGPKVNLAELKAMGVKDLYYLFGITVNKGKMNMSVFNEKPDVDNGFEKTSRRQRTTLGVRNDTDKLHIYLIVSDGCMYSDQRSDYPPATSNDKASYGLTKRESMILLSTLGCDCGGWLDGGGSSAMMIRYNGTVQQVNAVDFDSYGGRKLWDWIWFK